MVNFDAFKVAHQKYKQEEMPFLWQSRTQAIHKKPYSGLKILQNIPLTMESVLKIEPLVLGGAEVTVSNIMSMPPEKKALDILKAANINIQLEHVYIRDEYDFCLDCCGELLGVISPRRGAVELTQTGTIKYKNSNLTYPLISIDDSKIKLLETFFGSADAFIRAFLHVTRQELVNKCVVIFGGGRIGKGIAFQLKHYTNNISIIDVSDVPEKFLNLCKVNFINGLQHNLVNDKIKQADIIVTVTGVKNVISEFYNFNKADFHNAILINMGAEDEYGKNFSLQDVLFDKKPFNFMLAEPTKMKYLDPVFYAHNMAIDLLLSGKFSAGYHALPNTLAQEILDKWILLHNENINELLTYVL
ncbi:MAG: hypothetical protein CMF49_06780 [Legionellales bacterium]|nr:hypothetical protein [Legionellales bacterium]|tara:strand:+ start:1587 stop:2663 length:1077 start_codon:yes stop_codon:yes gene_type:complete